MQQPHSVSSSYGARLAARRQSDDDAPAALDQQQLAPAAGGEHLRGKSSAAGPAALGKKTPRERDAGVGTGLSAPSPAQPISTRVSLQELAVQELHQSCELPDAVGEQVLDPAVGAMLAGLPHGPVTPSKQSELTAVSEILEATGQGAQYALGLSKHSGRGPVIKTTWRTRWVARMDAAAAAVERSLENILC